VDGGARDGAAGGEPNGRAGGPAGGGELGLALERLCAEAEAQTARGCSILILTDRPCDERHAPIPMLLATAAVHHRLVRARKRMQVSILCDTGEPREDHDFACLIAFGATLVHPYLAYESVAALAAEDPRGGHGTRGSHGTRSARVTLAQALANYRAAVENGLLKIMSKMGIGPLSCYHGAQQFEAIGLDPKLIERHFTDTECRAGGVGLREIETDVLEFHADAFEAEGLKDRGIYRFRRDGEYHSMNPSVFTALHRAVREQSWEAFQEYSRLVDGRQPCSLRDLLDWKPAPAPVPLEEVEPAAEIARRFCTQAMSHGAISREAHEVLAIAMNRLGGKSNSGEGGEDRERYHPYGEERSWQSRAGWRPRSGDWANSSIKQVASGRFGVTPEYLVSARELEIKMAQGSKPGEGGQIPGHKVSGEIARIRRASPGVTLISPPPHHDVYSIEDLSQLIYDLKRVNRSARVCVKLVSGAGIGTIAAGVVKAYADAIQISGHDGGTGASPLGSIKNAGLPWELGLAETQQVLRMNRLRERVALRVDGGLKTGRDVVIAALLGADEFGFGTAVLVAAGCVMARQCHLNTCPVGVATQREELRQKFPGRPEHVIAFVLFVAEQVRLILARMGARRLSEIIGRTDLLVQKPGSGVDLSALLADPAGAGEAPGDPGDAFRSSAGARRRGWARNDRPEPFCPLDDIIWRDCEEAIRAVRPLRRRYPISNRERSVGARLSGEIARLSGERGVPPGLVELSFQGAAGQSFGAFCSRGMRLILEGEAQDGAGKGMAGGEIVIRPPADSSLASHENVILGNAVLYGATGGELYAAGIAGERLCVRNSGATAVVEGCGDHGCEYMTDGAVVILGRAGRNFGAGMTGGAAYVLDLEDDFQLRLNPETAALRRIGEGGDADRLRRLIQNHSDQTASLHAAWILSDWPATLPRFWKVSARPAAALQASAEPHPRAESAA
jgi:glutamate synthase domain-containing protein 2/glutamate synthase domain-containing protein 3